MCILYLFYVYQARDFEQPPVQPAPHGEGIPKTRRAVRLDEAGRQRVYYYERLDELFPGLRQKYERAYGEWYHCPVPDADRLAKVFDDLRSQHGIATCMTTYQPGAAKQLSLF